MPVKTTAGRHHAAGAIAQIVEEPAPLAVQRVGQYPAATVGFDTAPGVSLGAAVQAVRDAAQAEGLPGAITLRFTGASGAYPGSLTTAVADPGGGGVRVHRAGRAVRELRAPAHHPVHPALGGVGALLALLLTGHALDVVGIIGLVL
jgi:multidrug efflux pump